VISGFRSDVDDVCDLLAYYVALNGSCVSTFRDNLSVPPSETRSPLTLEGGTGRLTRNVGAEIPLNAA
jgi:hypothetical protein